MEIKINHPPIVASEVGLKLETRTVDSTKCTAVTENGRSVVKSGRLYSDSTNGVYGLVYEDVDITDGAKHASIMTGGYYDVANLPASAEITSTVAGNFEKHGLFKQTFEGIVIGDPENA